MMSPIPGANPRLGQRFQPPQVGDYYGLVNKMQTIDYDKLGELHMRLNKLLAQPVKKLKNNQKKGLQTTGAQDILTDGKAQWTTPTMLLLFLQNTIELCTPAPAHNDGSVSPASPGSSSLRGAREELKLRLPAWTDFKQTIYEIYDHRILHAPEINGAINNSYLGMNEHLILFFTNKYKIRPQVEKRIIEFLASLKYFVDHWLRAK